MTETPGNLHHLPELIAEGLRAVVEGREPFGEQRVADEPNPSVAEVMAGMDILFDELNFRRERDRTSKAYFDDLFENVPIMMARYSPDGVVERVNRCLVKTLGWSAKEWEEKSRIPEVYPEPEELARVVDYMTRPDQRWHRFQSRTKSGETVETAWLTHRFHDDSLVGMGIDVTEREQITAELNTIIDNLPLALFVKSVDELRLVRVNAIAEKLFRRPRAELLGKTNYDLFSKEAADHYTKSDRAALRDEKAVHAPLQTVDSESGPRFFRTTKVPIFDATSGEPRFLLCIADDITEKVKREQDSQLLANVIQCTDDAIITANTQGYIVSWNPGAARMFGYTAEEIIGEHVLRLSPEDGGQTRHVFRMVLAGRPLRNFESVRRRKDGTLIPVSITVSPIVVEEGRLVGVSAIMRDMSQRVAAEKALQSAVDAATAANVAKSQFLANMSHEIRTPMNGVIGMTQVLADSKLSEEQRDYVETIQESAQNLLKVLDDVLDVSKIESGNLRLETLGFDLVAVVRSVAALFRQAASDKVLEYSVVVSEDVPDVVAGDPHRIRQVLSNLIGNAIKFTYQGHVTVEVRVVDRSEAAARCRIEVRDSGIGLEPQVLDKLFQPFQQADGSTSRKYGGSGLGLSISKQLVELMGGLIEVSSEVGVGSTFSFELPLGVGVRPDDELKILESEVRRTPIRSEVPAASARVLVAEDNRINQKVIRAMLKQLACEVEVVGDGAQAVEAVRAQHYDLVLMDCQMPVLDGFEATKKIRELAVRSDIPIVAMTAQALHGDKAACLAAGMDGYLAKPVVKEQLELVLSKWVKTEPEATGP